MECGGDTVRPAGWTRPGLFVSERACVRPPTRGAIKADRLGKKEAKDREFLHSIR
jgi:hypothetical protein